jgi:hypothetical protein
MSVRVNVFYEQVTYHIFAEKHTTIKELLTDLDIQETIVFSGSGTPLVDLSKTLTDYNMWFLDDYVAEISVYKKTDNYDKNLYDMYLAAQ